MEHRKPAEEELFDMAELFKVFGDSTRIRILYEMFDRECSVSELSEALGMSLSAISHQLRLLEAVEAGQMPPRRQNGVL